MPFQSLGNAVLNLSRPPSPRLQIEKRVQPVSPYAYCLNRIRSLLPNDPAQRDLQPLQARRDLMHHISFEIVTEYCIAHTYLHASKLAKKVSTNLGVVHCAGQSIPKRADVPF